MYKSFSFLLFVFSLSIAKADFYAIELLETFGKAEVLSLCKENNAKTIYLENEHFVLVESNNIDWFPEQNYVAKLRFWENHFLFNTRTILLKIESKDVMALQAKYLLKSHPIIPNLYYHIPAIQNEQQLTQVMEDLKSEPGVIYVENKQVFTLQVTTNDPMYNRQWSIENTGSGLQSNGTPDADMQIDSAWTISQGDTTVKIAVLDSGVDTLHEDLLENLLGGFDGYATDSTDTKGYPTPNYDSDGHGTCCAGIVAAQANNNKGIAGIAHNCKIVPIRIFYYQDYGGSVGIQATTNTDALLSGSAYAWRVAEADVMSTSAGLNSLFIGVLGVNTQIIDDEINTAFYDARSGYGIPMFFSAGNDDFNDVLWPADLDNTIAVGASSMCDERKNPTDCSPETWGSSYGYNLDVVAPGVRISTCDMSGLNGYTNGAYTTTFNGTSAACPNAAAVGALILSLNPILHARDVKAILNITAERVTGYTYDSTTVHGSWNEEVGHGRVDAFAALKLAQTYVSTVGIKEAISSIDIAVFPNPSNGVISILNNSEEDQMIQVYTVLGQYVSEVFVMKGQKLSMELENNAVFWLKNKKGNFFTKVITH